MQIPPVIRCLGMIISCGLLCACGTKQTAVPQLIEPPAFTAEAQTPRKALQEEVSSSTIYPQDYGFTERVITEEELWRVSERDPDLSPVVCRQILARLNIKAHYYISDDMEKKRRLKVPNSFSAYKNWTPLPRSIAGLSKVDKLILVAKDLFFLGWYERGHLMGDTQVCLGVEGQSTIAGVYKVEEKDKDHISRSYTNSFGRPAWMPWSMRIYEAVWIHAGDITGAYCSHGCVTLPLKTAQEVFEWAEPGTPVVIVETMNDLEKTLKERSGLLASRAH